MNDLVKRLRIKAGMIEMGEMIAWGSDSALMREAADALELAAPDAQGEPLRYTHDGALAQCPCCGSLDAGGAHDTVSCYSCDLTVTKPRPLQNAIDAWNTRTGRTHPVPAVQGELGGAEQQPDVTRQVEAAQALPDACRRKIYPQPDKGRVWHKEQRAPTKYT